MHSFALILHFYRHKWRWLIVAGVMSGLAFLVQFMGVGGYEPQNVWDFLLVVFTQKFYVMMLAPALFLFLIVDALVEDFHQGYAGITLSRSTSRGSWLMAKVSTIFALAVLYTLGVALVFFMWGLVLGYPFSTTWGENAIVENIPPLSAVLVICTLMVGGLASFGSFVVMLTLFFRSSVFPWIVGIILCIMSYMTWQFHAVREFFVWMPTAQMMFLTHFPNLLTETVEGFTLRWSYTYCCVLFLVSVMIGMLRFRAMDLTKSD